MYKHDIAMLSGLFEKDKESEILSKSVGNVQMAANALQWSIVNGMDHWLEKPVTLINAIDIGSYPKRYKELRIPYYEWSHTQGAADINVDFNNLCVYKHVNRAIQVGKYAKAWAREKADKKILLIYSAQSPLLSSAIMAKKANPDIKLVLIVPDLPQYLMLDSKTFSKRIAEKLNIFLIKKQLPYIDAYVLLTKHMAGMLGKGKAPFAVVEGIAANTSNISARSPENAGKVVLYSGTLAIKFGILTLIKAMGLIEDPDVRLVICGEGEGKKSVMEASKNDRRIVYLGMLPRSEVLELQKKADVLINPRQNTDAYTKYSFPSKILEYLSSGTPVIAYKLDGIPDEYDNYIHYVADDSVETLAKTIEDFCSLPPDVRHEIGLRAREFVRKEKSCTVQAEKIMQLIETL